MIENAAADAANRASLSRAMLHDRDMRASRLWRCSPAAVHALLRMLALEPADRRARGGPAKIWASDGHPSIAIEQIDYDKMLAREQGDVPAAARRDDLWRSIVTSMAGGLGAVFDERAQERLLMIAGSPADIADTALAASSSMCAPDGVAHDYVAGGIVTPRSDIHESRLRWRHRSAERGPTKLAAAATQLNPKVVMQILQTDDEPTATFPS